MPVITTLKSSRTREKRALLKEEAEAQRVLQTNVNDDRTEIRRHLLNIGKVLLNLEMKLSRLELANEKLSEAYEQANDTEGAEQFQLTLDEESEIIDGVIDKVSQLKILKEELEQRRRETETTGIANSCSPQPIAPLRPPQLDITPFGGDILKWQEFWDAFEASVHNAKYAAVDKLNYLKSRLKGEALEAISGYQLSNENYTVVVDMLKKRFGNQQLIIDAHYRSLSNIPPATNQVSKLRQCYDTIECHLRSLEAVGEQVDHRHFVALILEKLPQKVRCQLYMQKPKDEEWTTPSLRKLLGKYISAMEMAGGESSERQPTVSNSSRLVPRHHPLQPRPTAEGLLATNSKENLKEVQIRCVHCSKPHWSDECLNYVTLQARKERLKGCCFNCLKKGHTLRDCTRDRACVHCGRRKNHHRSLCQRLFEEPTKQTSESQNISTIDDTGSVLMASSSHILMQTATVVVKNSQGDASEKIHLILNSGSKRSYVTESVAKRLKLPLNSTERLSVVTFGTNKPKKIDCKLSKVQLSLQDKSTTTLNVTVVPNITGTIHRVPLIAEDLEFLKKRFNQDMLADSLPCHTESATIDMLIGNDYYFDLLEPQKLDLGGKLFLFNSKLGWILGGQTENTYARKTTVPSLLASTVGTVSVGPETTTPMFSNTDPSLACKPDLEQFWNLESIGIMDSPKMCDDDQALENFQKMIRHEDNRYFVTWPWKDSNLLLPDNYQLASGRLKSILGRLQKNPQLFQSYATIIQEQLERGIIEKVTNESVEGPNKHYIPHHAVITPTKNTTKVRVVYDASAKTKQMNKSLNECLYRGPVMLSDLCGLLIRFRLSPIAVIADIEKAFLSVGLQAADRDVTRFLWLKDPTVMKLDNNVQIYRFCRVPFGVISSPFLATISYHLQQSDNQFAEVLKPDIYVDNIITGVNTIEEAKTLYNEAKSLFAAASMNLREWASNSQQLMECVPQCDQAANSEQKVLGIKWNLSNDTLLIPGNSTDKSRCVSTKREVLHMTACIFDPLGFFAPTVLKAKLFMKKLWSERLGWDEKLGDGLLKGQDH